MRTFWLTLLFAVLAAMLLAPLFLQAEPAADEELAIVSPHWDGIRHEFARGFSQYYFEKHQRRVQIVWVDVGGTNEIRKYLEARLQDPRRTAAHGAVADVLFGGGMDILPRMAADNYFEPLLLPPEYLSAIPETINGQQLRDPQGRYFAACLSGFGFVYNTRVIEMANLPEPRTWDDLAGPRYQGWVSCGNPTQSGSLHMIFELVLQGQGWEQGYTTLARLASNTRAFNEGGTSVPRDVSLGQAAAGPCIDFYASAPIRRQGATHLQLVIPKGQAIATPDCVAVLRQPRNPAAARAFVEFVLSEEGQKLWYLARGEPGGPQEYDLERLPVRPSLYTQNLKTHTVINPFQDKPDFQYDGKKAGERWTLLNDLWRGAMIDVHDALWDARKEIVAAGRDHDLGVALGRAPLSEEALQRLAKAPLRADARNALRNKWSVWARNWFAALRRAAREQGPVPEFVPAPVE